eukprot:2206321-Pleurochrysis_carterae.AAC.3
MATKEFAEERAEVIFEELAAAVVGEPGNSASRKRPRCADSTPPDTLLRGGRSTARCSGSQMVKRLASRRGRVRCARPSMNTAVTFNVCGQFAFATWHAIAAGGMRMAQRLFNATYVIDRRVDAINREMAKVGVD